MLKREEGCWGRVRDVGQEVRDAVKAVSSSTDDIRRVSRLSRLLEVRPLLLLQLWSKRGNPDGHGWARCAGGVWCLPASYSTVLDTDIQSVFWITTSVL
jgi:hypothetical protein